MSQFQLTIAEEGGLAPIRHQTFDGDDRLEVRDITTRITLAVCAKEISPYRHTLFLGGKTFRILNVVKRL